MNLSSAYLHIYAYVLGHASFTYIQLIKKKDIVMFLESSQEISVQVLTDPNFNSLFLSIFNWNGMLECLSTLKNMWKIQELLKREVRIL